MKSVSLAAMTAYCDRLLKPAEFNDWEAAVNGLQVENAGTVSRIAAAVDASLATVNMAIAAKADLLLVHHGLFWGGSHPWTGRRYELLRRLLDENLAVYSSHLPLDAHPRLGNNPQLCAALGWRKGRPFFFERGRYLGVRVRASVERDVLAQRVGQVLGKPAHLLPGGPGRCREIGIVTGGAGAELAVAAREGVDTFITGEGPHWTYNLAEELGINVIYGGHYATETFGVKALAAHLGRKYGLPWVFLDRPTGL